MRKGWKYLAVLLAVILFASAWYLRVRHVNNSITVSTPKYYAMGETVPYEDDFFYRADPETNPYKIVVNEAKLVPFRQYMEDMGLDLERWQSEGVGTDEPQYIYDIHITVICDGESPDGMGIDLFNTLLTTSRVRLRVDMAVFSQLYPQLQGSFTFRLRSNSQMEFHFPYRVEMKIEERVATYDYLKNETLDLILTLYPQKKMVRVTAE